MQQDLNKLFPAKRTGKQSDAATIDLRTEYQRDFDRIIFSSAFRRLQNKTQVFPLPGSVFVHNRLTHSLEVASVGRSLGSLAGDFIVSNYGGSLNEDSKEFYRNSLYNVISSACLCHDIGNPAFGHSGEDAIASYFKKNEGAFKGQFTQAEWADFVNFEGNANAIRILTQHQTGKSEGGIQLTYATLASIAKYPCESSAKTKGIIHRKKFGFFQSEKETFKDIAENSCMIKDNSLDLVSYFRHPFVWLVEAADDICYNIIDLEDAHRLGFIEHGVCINMLKDLIAEIKPEDTTKVEAQLAKIGDRNEKITYLRAKSIGLLTARALYYYQTNFEAILDGSFREPLYDCIMKESKTLDLIKTFSQDNIYAHRSVLEIENAGYHVMSELLTHFVNPVLTHKDNRTKSEKTAVKLMPQQFLYEQGTNYQKVMGVLDYVSGMTDNYATDLYRKIKGIDIGMTI
jgi:dGTPase